MVELVTERLRLRPPRENDLDAYARFYADPEVMRFIGGKPRTRAESNEALRSMVQRYEIDGFGMLTVERLDDGVVVGRAGLNVWDARAWRFGTRAELGEHAEIELAWTLGREHWGRGYATEAARAVRDWTFDELRLKHLISLVHPENTASIRVVERLRAVHERDVETESFGPARLYVHPTP
jgi:RimJ/RimL family protein N-acetyltransferase